MYEQASVIAASRGDNLTAVLNAALIAYVRRHTTQEPMP